MRYWILSGGRLSLRDYRLFLFHYFVFQVPLLSICFLAFIVLGYRRPEGFFKTDTQSKLIVFFCVYLVLCLWPLMVASIKRIHDLGYRFRDVFLSVNFKRNFRLARDMLMKESIDSQRE